MTKNFIPAPIPLPTLPPSASPVLRGCRVSRGGGRGHRWVPSVVFRLRSGATSAISLRKTLSINLEIRKGYVLHVCQKSRRIGCVIPRCNLQRGFTQPILHLYSVEIANLKRRHGELAGAEEEDDGGGDGERHERGDEVAGRRGRVVRVQRLVVVSRCRNRGSSDGASEIAFTSTK